MGALSSRLAAVGEKRPVGKDPLVAVSGWMVSLRVADGSTSNRREVSGARARPQMLYKSLLGRRRAKKHWPRIDSSIECGLGE